MEQQDDLSLHLSPAVRAGTVVLALGGMAALFDAATSLEFFSTGILAIFIATLAKPALTGEVPAWWFGMSVEEISEMYERPLSFTKRDDDSGVVTALVLGGSLLVLLGMDLLLDYVKGG